jgi:hypothetical protein
MTMNSWDSAGENGELFGSGGMLPASHRSSGSAGTATAAAASSVGQPKEGSV